MRTLKYRRLAAWLAYASLFVVSITAAFLLRFDFAIPQAVLPLLRLAAGVAISGKLLVAILTRLDRAWCRYAGAEEAMRVLVANIYSSVLVAAVLVLLCGASFPRSIYLIDFLVSFVLWCGVRFAARIYGEGWWVRPAASSAARRILIYGAGAAGATLVREIRTNRSLGLLPVGFVDDNRRKLGTLVHAVPVLGDGRMLARIAEQECRRQRPISEVVIAIPSASGKQLCQVLANARAARLPCRTVPGLGELLTKKVLSAQIRDLSVNDLLGRDPVRLENESIRKQITGKVVLVTGGAGSIGSELCRQITNLEPKKLILFDKAESDLFRLDHELAGLAAETDRVVAIGDIKNATRVEEVIREHAVEVIFHAAAYKHVPLMEKHVIEAVENNVLGTWNLAQAALSAGVSSFLMISTDKAVNPTSVMGATKRVAELIVTAMRAGPGAGTNFVSVRFGNVLGSNGSVVPLFQSQIAAGGPVTVTHPDMRRYFMTIREAVQLVLQAFAMGRGSEIFVLDMGEPVSITDLARNMIRLSGLVPDEDIEIRFTGLRPGERLNEELTSHVEHMLPTRHEKIRIFRGPRPGAESIERWMSDLATLIDERSEAEIIQHIQALLPEYSPSETWSRRIHKLTCQAATA